MKRSFQLKIRRVDAIGECMKPQSRPLRHTIGLAVSVCALGINGWLAAQEALQPAKIQRLSSGEIILEQATSAGVDYRIEASANLQEWISLITVRSTGLIQHTDTAAPYLSSRFYRTLPASGSGLLTGDHLATDDGDIIFHPINHASFVMSWKGMMIYNDAVGGAALYQGLPRADLILVSHSHGDHFESATITSVRKTNAVIIAPQAVYNSLSTALKSQTIILANGASTNILGLTVEAVPAYNSNHPKGQGNGYVVTMGGKRIYMSGDTGDTPEMRALQGIDVAFLAMNVPFTMSVDSAASAVRDFRPRVVYPYHYRNQNSTFADLTAFKRQVGTDHGVEIRSRKWY
jgi:L-ascorbate metabolism protein UlaG (beta-lactamase superfamily)